MGEGDVVAERPAFPYRWFWKCKLPERTGQECRVLTRGKMGTVLVEFPDGFRVTTARYAVRRAR